jgi:nicotinamide-nucleotide amidase
MTKGLNILAETVLSAARKAGFKIATAESCTGGLIAGALTEIAGSSDVVDRGFVTYSNEAKQQMLDVSVKTLEQFGAVSAATAKEMAYGALAHSMSDIAVSVTGVAGPGGGSAEKPVGTVWFGLALQGEAPYAEVMQFGDQSRHDIRSKTVKHALQIMLDAMKG